MNRYFSNRQWEKGIILATFLLWSIGYGLSGLDQAAAAEKTISLVLGRSEVVDFPGVVRVAVGDATIADVKVIARRQIMITGISKGVTNVTIWKGDGRKDSLLVRVLTEDPFLIARDVKEILGELEGIKIRVVGDLVILDGEIFTDRDYERIKTVTQMFPQVTNFVQKSGVSIKQMVQIDVKMMEVSRSARKNIGLNWQDLLKVDASGSFSMPLVGEELGDLTGNIGIVSNFGVVLNMMMSDGSGRVLSNPVLVCKSEEKASFLAGGEIPIPVKAEEGSITVEWKQYGMILRFEPVADAYNNINMKILAEISEVDFSQGVESGGIVLPAVITRKSDTMVNLTQGETIVLAELMSHKNSKIVEKIPIIGQLPIVGELFKSREFKQERTEFLVFVTPTIVKPGSLEQRKIVEMEDKYRREGRKQRFHLLD
ncbi:MAG: pilus assembly protein N-terminal domain-containing protein [Deltaproteobacteria bacterium]|nr:MAG: pilus assembly protein N-terminal domain-containing protein [Deltaproteobacteria bacterium]